MLDESSKCNPDLSKEDLLRLLACLQSELEARDVVIGALKSERQALINAKAKYGVADFRTIKPSVFDPFEALQRDSMLDMCRNSVESSNISECYDSQLAQLENLISTQHGAQQKMREQHNFMEKKYIKIRGQLDEEKRKREHETAQGDDVLVMLEKERERLKSEADDLKAQNKMLEKDIKRLIHVWKEQSILVARQKEVTVSLLIERRRQLKHLSQTQTVNDHQNMEYIRKPSIGYVDSIAQTDFVDDSISKNMCGNESDGAGTHYTHSQMSRKSLEAEVSCRNEVEQNYQRLKQDYEKLLEEVNLLRSSKSSTPIDSNTKILSSTDAVANTFRSTSMSTNDADSKLPESTSAVTPMRTKPHPPARRSSEVTNVTVPAPSQSPIPSPTLIPSVNGPLVDETLSNTNDVASQCTTEVPTCKGVTNNGYFPVDSSSRSSTPSPPPPPPPPVQLHYPYPGMQSHLQTSQGRVVVTSTAGNSDLFFPRPIISLVSTSTYGVVRPRVPPVSNTSPYVSLNSCPVINRMNLPSTPVRSSTYRTPASVNVQQQQQTIISQPSNSLHSTNVSSSEAAFHPKSPPLAVTAPVTLNQRRKSPLPSTSQPQHQNQPLSPYSPRYHHHPRQPHRYPSVGSIPANTSGGNNTIAPSGTPVTTASHAVRTIRTHSSGPPEHVCIGGK